MRERLGTTPSKIEVFEIVREALLRVRREQTPGFDAEVRLDTSLVALGLDSLSLVEAVVALEETLCIEHLSLEALHDRAPRRDGECFTVESLVNLCMQHAAA